MSQAELLIASFARDEGAGQLWDAIGGQPCPPDLEDAFRDPSVTFVAHNMPFDAAGTHRLTPYRIPLERRRCTSAQAASHGYPQSLEGVGAALELPPELRKFESGKALIQRFCIPFDGKYFDRYTHPSDWDDFCEYGLQDGVTLREIHKRLPKVNYQGENLQTWFIDQLINERGFGFDQELARAARQLLDSQKGRHERDMAARTEGQVESATQRARLLAYFQT